jgi:hypothetical protein
MDMRRLSVIKIFAVDTPGAALAVTDLALTAEKVFGGSVGFLALIAFFPWNDRV